MAASSAFSIANETSQVECLYESSSVFSLKESRFNYATGRGMTYCDICNTFTTGLSKENTIILHGQRFTTCGNKDCGRLVNINKCFPADTEQLIHSVVSSINR